METLYKYTITYKNIYTQEVVTDSLWLSEDLSLEAFTERFISISDKRYVLSDVKKN